MSKYPADFSLGFKIELEATKRAFEDVNQMVSIGNIKEQFSYAQEFQTRLQFHKDKMWANS